MSKRPSPKDLLASRNPLTRQVVAPVDIYDQINEASQKAAAAPKKDAKPAVKQAKPAKNLAKKSSDPDLDPVGPYSTYLRKSQVKQIKHRAVDMDVKDQHIVQAAIDEYFTRHPD